MIEISAEPDEPQLSPNQETMSPDKSEVLKEIHRLIFDFVSSATAEELEDLERLLYTEIKITIGCKEAQYILTPLESSDSMDMMHTTMRFDKSYQRDIPGANKGELKIEIKEKSRSKAKNEAKIDAPLDKGLIPKKQEAPPKDSLPKSTLPARFKLPDSPVQTNKVIQNLLLAEPLTAESKLKISISFILDDIKLYLFGTCGTCLEGPSGCAKCKSKAGVRAKITGFTFTGKQIKITAWTNHLSPLTKLSKGRLIESVQLFPDHIRVEFLKLYRARLFIASCQYRKFEGELSLNTQTLYSATFEHLNTILCNV